MSRSIAEEQLISLLLDGMPFALLSRPVEAISCDTITVDNQGGAASAAAHLIMHGQRRIALISGPKDSPARNGCSVTGGRSSMQVSPSRMISSSLGIFDTRADLASKATEHLTRLNVVP